MLSDSFVECLCVCPSSKIKHANVVENMNHEMLVTLGWSDLHIAAEKVDLEGAKEVLQKDAALINDYDRFGRTPLSIAASKGSAEFVKWLLERGAEVCFGFPLHYAAEQGHCDVLKCLIKNGADVNLAKDRNYPLIIAATNGHFKAAKVLIQHGADIKAVNETKSTALHMACLDGSLELISFLLDCGCDVYAKNKFDNTPLQTCVLFGNEPEMAKILIEKGARLDVIDSRGATLLHELNQPTTLLELVKGGGDVNARDYEGKTPLYVTAEESYDLECAKILLEHGADPNIPSKGGLTPLHFAARHGKLELAKELLRKGAKVNAANAQNIIPLHLAAKENHIEIAKLLLEHGSLINVSTGRIPYVNSYNCILDVGGGWTPIDLARARSHHALVKFLETYNSSDDKVETITVKGISEERHNYLIKAMMEIQLPKEVLSSRRENMGFTVLHDSILHCSYELSCALIKQGLSVNALDYYDRTPLSLAAATNNTKMIKLLVAKGADVNLGLPLHYAMLCNASDAVLALVKYKCDMNSENETIWGSTVLVEAAGECCPAMVKLLLENGADVHAVNKLGQTALHNSCHYNDQASASLLLKHGAKVNVVDKNNDTPLTLAASYSASKISKMLIDHGADVHAKDGSLWTPLQRAVAANKPITTSDLIRAGADVNYFTQDVESPLYLAAEFEKILGILLDNGANVNFAAFGGWTTLHECAAEGWFGSAKLLLDRGANINLGSADNILPIYLASVGGYFNIAEELLKRGSLVDPRILDFGVLRTDHPVAPSHLVYHIVVGNTPLIGAASRGHSEVVKLLHSYGADLNATNSYGNTALHEAVVRNYVDIVQFLIDLNVNVDVRNRNRKTALDLAKLFRSEECLAILEK